MSGKPLGIDIVLSGGVPVFRMSPIDRTTDRIWDAVREAINANMTPEQFKQEVIQAWKYHLEEDIKHAIKELRK